jgi:hypothetical protein
MTKHEKAVKSTSAEDTVDVTLNGLLDEALDKLSPWQKWVVERNFKRSPQNRRQALHAVEMHLAKTAPALMSVMDGEEFNADTKFKTTVAGKGELLQVILENLPAILDAIIKLIGLFGAILLACILLTSSASAQDGACSVAQGGQSCANGVCSLRSRVSAAVGLQAVSNASPQAVYSSTTTVNHRISTVTVVGNTRQRFQPKPLRTFIGGFRPFNRVIASRRRC